jgi:hypothetical protein
MAVPKRIRFKADDIWDTPDDGKRYEVIDGQLYVTPPPVTEHQGALGVLCRYLRLPRASRDHQPARH